VQATLTFNLCKLLTFSESSKDTPSAPAEFHRYSIASAAAFLARVLLLAAGDQEEAQTAQKSQKSIPWGQPVPKSELSRTSHGGLDRAPTSRGEEQANLLLVAAPLKIWTTIFILRCPS